MGKLLPASPFVPPLRLSLLVLAILADGEAHGYSIMKSIKDLTMGHGDLHQVLSIHY